MAEIINLRRARKAHARAVEKARADENRIRHGQTKAEKATLEAEAKRLDRVVDGARREPADGDGR